MNALPFSILVIGQSNAMGRYGPVSAPVREDVQAWDWKQQAFVPAQLGVIPFWPVPKVGGPAGNLAYTLACAIADQRQEPATVALFASDGQRIEYFLPSDVLAQHGWTNAPKLCRHFGASMAPYLYGSESSAHLCLQAAGKSAYDLIAVHQGEAQVSSPVDSAELILEKYRALIAALRRDHLASPSTQIIFGRISPGYANEGNHAAALRQLSHEGIAVAEWRGIEDMAAIGVPGNRHASGAGLGQLGMRFFEQWQALEKHKRQT